MRFPVRRVAFGFAAGAAVGWLASLLRAPASAPEGSSADEAVRLPQEDFGEAPVESAAEDAAERAVAAPAVALPPEETSEPAAEAAVVRPAPRKRTRARAGTQVADPAAGATETLRDGHAAVSEQLSEAVRLADEERRRAHEAANRPEARRRSTARKPAPESGT